MEGRDQRFQEWIGRTRRRSSFPVKTVSFLLDTNAWKTLAAGGGIAARAKVLTEPETTLFLLDISFWEVCKAVGCGTLKLDRPPLEWIGSALVQNVAVLGITPEIADLSCKLSSQGLATHDPADQLICAAAKIHRLTLATRDRKIISWGGVPTLEY